MDKVIVLLASGCEEIEAVTVIDLLRRARIDVMSAGLGNQGEQVVCSRGVVLVPDTVIEKIMDEDIAMVVLPGGQPGTDNLRKDERVRTLLRQVYDDGKYVAAICAAPMVLAEAGILDERSATSFPGCLDKTLAPHTTLREDAVVVDSRVITSRGPGTAMLFGLALIEMLAGRKIRDQVAEGLQLPK